MPFLHMSWTLMGRSPQKLLSLSDYDDKRYLLDNIHSLYSCSYRNIEFGIYILTLINIFFIYIISGKKSYL